MVPVSASAPEAEGAWLVEPGAPEDSGQPDLHRLPVRRGEDGPKLLLDLVGARERSIPAKQLAETSTILRRVSFPITKQKPAAASSARPPLLPRTKEDLATDLVDRRATSFMTWKGACTMAARSKPRVLSTAFPKARCRSMATSWIVAF